MEFEKALMFDVLRIDQMIGNKCERVSRGCSSGLGKGKGKGTEDRRETGTTVYGVLRSQLV